MSQLILQPFYHFTYITQLILLPFHCFIYVIGTSPMSQLILQPFRCFIYTTAHSTTLLPLYLQHSSFYCHSVASPTSPGKPPMPLWWWLIYPWLFCNLQWLRPAGLYERCKLPLKLKRLKTPDVDLRRAFTIHVRNDVLVLSGRPQFVLWNGSNVVTDILLEFLKWMRVIRVNFIFQCVPQI